MNIFGIKIGSDKKESTKSEMELLEKEKQEYKLIGKYLRKKGLKLFAYNPLKEVSLREIKVAEKNDLHLLPDERGKLVAKDLGLEEVEVDSRDIHFEALNLKNANKRVQKYISGEIKELCNLRNPEELE